MIKYFTRNRDAFFVILISTLMRIVFVAAGWSYINSDEATMGIMARQISALKAFPWVFAGQDYMGTFEAYVAAPFFLILGPSPFALRLSAIIIYSAFMVCMYIILKWIFGKSFAIFALILFGSSAVEVLARYIEATAGASYVVFFGALIFLVSGYLIKLYRDETFRVWRGWYFALWGMLMGVAIWSNPLVLPVVGMSCVVVFLVCTPIFSWRLMLVVVLSVALGLAPQIMYKVVVPPSSEALALVGYGYREAAPPKVQGSTGGKQTQANQGEKPSPVVEALSSFYNQIAGTIVVSLPVATGGNALCPTHPNKSWPIHSDLYTIGCSGVHSAWGISYIILLMWVFVSAGKKLILLSGGKGNGDNEGKEIAKYAMVVMIAGSTLGTIAIYMLFPQAAITPWPSSRYLSIAFLAFPLILYPIWNRLYKRQSRKYLNAKNVMQVVVCGIFLYGSLSTALMLPNFKAASSGQQGLVTYLENHHYTRVYTDYWSCNSIVFLSQENVVCGVLDGYLRPGLNRFKEFRVSVDRVEKVVYVFKKESSQDKVIKERLKDKDIEYSEYFYDDYVIYDLGKRV